MKPQFIGIGIVLAIAVYLLSSSFVVVSAGHVGIVKTLGAFQP